MDELQEGIKIARRNINNLRYADDTTLKVESKEEIKTFLMRLKEKSEKKLAKSSIFFKSQYLLNILKTEIMGMSPITLWQTEREKVAAVTDFFYLGSKNNADDGCSLEIRRRLTWQESHEKFRPCVTM